MPISSLATTKGLVGGPFGSSLVGSDYELAGVPVVRGTNLGFGKYLGGSFVYVSEEKVARDLARNTAAPGDIVFTQRGTLGQVALVDDSGSSEYVVSQSQMRLRVDPEVAVAEFVYYACSTNQFLKQISDNAISTGVPHINLGILGRLTVPLPSLAAQTGIVNVLGALDDKIAANNKLITVAEELAILLAGQIKPTVAVGDLANHLKQSVVPLLLDASCVAHFSLPAYDIDKLPALTLPADILSSKFLIAQPSVLISKLNPRFPRVWNVADLPIETALASTEFLVLDPLWCSTTVLWAILSQNEFAINLDGKAAGTSGSHQRVRPDDLLATLVGDPRQMPDGVKARITNIGLTALERRAENRSLGATRDALLPQLMLGKLRVKDAEKTLAGVL